MIFTEYTVPTFAPDVVVALLSTVVLVGIGLIGLVLVRRRQ